MRVRRSREAEGSHLANNDTAQATVSGPLEFSHPVLLVRADSAPERRDALTVVGVNNRLKCGVRSSAEVEATREEREPGSGREYPRH